MDDLISRQVVIDAFYLQSDDDGWWCGTAEDMETLLKGLPSAQQWIPVSEELPDRVGFYWTTAVGGSGTRTMTSRFFDGTKWERKRRDYTKVIAWMPLPEAYKEGE